MKCIVCGEDNKGDKLKCIKCGSILNYSDFLEEEKEIREITSNKPIVKKENNSFLSAFKDKLIKLGVDQAEVFKMSNIIIGIILLVLFINIFSLILGSLNQVEKNPKVFFVSDNTLYVHESNRNLITEIATVDDYFDFEQVKSSNENSYIYYPKKHYFFDGISKFDVVRASENEGGEIFADISHTYHVSEDGNYFVFFDDVLNLYGEYVAKLYYINIKDTNKKILIAEDVIISSVKLSSNSKELIYITSEDNELFRYNFNNRRSIKLESGVFEVIYNSENLKNLVLIKHQKSVADFNIYTMFSVINNSSNKLSNGVIKDSIFVSDDTVIYLRVPKNYTKFEMLDKYTENLSKTELKQVKKEFDDFVTKNVFQLYQIDLRGNSEILLSDNVYLLNFISENAEDIILTKFKEQEEIDIANIETVEDLLENKNLVSYVMDINRDILELERVKGDLALSVDENYGFDTITNKIYYLDSNNLIELNYSSSYNIHNIDSNVKQLWYYNDILYYLKDNNSLVSFYRSGDLEYFDINVIPESIVLSENRLYYQKENYNGNIELYIKVNDNKVELLSENLSSKEILAFGQYVYFIDIDDGLSYYDGSRIRQIDKNADNVYKLLNN